MENNAGKFPDVTAFRADEAMRLLDDKGVDYYIKSLRRSRDLDPENDGAVITCKPQSYRVVKQVVKGPNLLELLVAAEAGFNQR